MNEGVKLKEIKDNTERYLRNDDQKYRKKVTVMNECEDGDKKRRKMIMIPMRDKIKCIRGDITQFLRIFYLGILLALLPRPMWHPERRGLRSASSIYINLQPLNPPLLGRIITRKSFPRCLPRIGKG